MEVIKGSQASLEGKLCIGIRKGSAQKREGNRQLRSKRVLNMAAAIARRARGDKTRGFERRGKEEKDEIALKNCCYRKTE